MSLLILQTSPDSWSACYPSIMGVRKRDGIEGTDIFCRLGLLTNAAALPELIGERTVSGLMTPMRPRRLFCLSVGLKKSDCIASYWPGPGICGKGSFSSAVYRFLFEVAMGWVLWVKWPLSFIMYESYVTSLDMDGLGLLSGSYAPGPIQKFKQIGKINF